MENFDPLSASFTFDVDPIVADQQALVILPKLREAQRGLRNIEKLRSQGETLSPEFEALVSQYKDHIPKLEANLKAYKGYKAYRGELPLSYAPEARARSSAEDREKITREVVKMFKADDATFKQYVKDQGDEDFYNEWESMMAGTGQSAKERYLVNKSMRLFGFSDREIASGYVEPMVRQITGAKDAEGEPTHGAILRWSLDQVNQYDRRHKIEQSAFDNAHITFMGMTDDKNDESFEKLVAAASPDLTDEERTMIRVVRNNIYGQLETKYGHIRPLVKKTFNTIMMQDDAVDKEQGDRFPDGKFTDMSEAAAEFAKLKPEEFQAVTAMLAETAKAHGRNVDGFMNNMAAALERGLDNTIGMASRGLTADFIEWQKSSVNSDQIQIPENWTIEDKAKIMRLISAEYAPSFSGMADSSGIGAIFERNARIDNALGADADKPTRKLTAEEKAIISTELDMASRATKYVSQLANWRESVAKVDKGEWYSPKNWAYGLTQSLPEMAMSLNPGGWGVIFAAQQERLRTDMRNREGVLELSGAQESGILLASAAYTGLSAFEGKILFSRMPGVKSFVGQFLTRMGAETLQELGQDGADPIVRKLYNAMGADMADVNLFTDGGLWNALTKKGGELSNLITEAPRIMFTVAPLVLLSVGGNSVANKMDQQALARLVHNESLLYMVGLDQKEIADMQKLNTAQAVDFLNRRYVDKGFTVRSEAELREAGLPLPEFPMTPGDMQAKAELEMDSQLEMLGIKPADPNMDADTHRRWAQQQAVELLDMAGVKVPDGLDFLTRADHINEGLRQLREEYGIQSMPRDFAGPDERMEWSRSHLKNPTIAINEDGSFSVSHKGNSVVARSPEEVAEAARGLEGGNFKPTRLVVAPNRITSTPEAETLGFTPGWTFGESELRIREGLPPSPNTRQGITSRIARARYGLQQFLFSRKVPSHSLDAVRVKAERLAKGVSAQFERIALTLDNRIKEHVMSTPLAQRDVVAQQIQSDAYLALRGDQQALAALPPRIRDAVSKGRESIDAYSAELANSNAVTPELANTLQQNMGSYITRQFKVFDKNSGWNYTTVKRDNPQIYTDAMNYLQQQKGLSAKEADQAIIEMLDPSRADDFLAGSGKVAKMDVTSFFKKKDLAPEIVALLGEIDNPAVNIRNTGAKVSEMVITNNAQVKMADWLLRNGLASRTVDGRRSVMLGRENVAVPSLDSNGNPTVFYVERTKRAYAGFGKLYVEPEMAAALQEAFEPGGGTKSKFQWTFDALVKITSAGKFAQVILNPAAYPTNFIGGVATEIFNGRLSFDAKGARAYLKGGHRWNGATRTDGDIYGVKEQQAMYATTGAQFNKAGGVNKLTYNQIGTEMEQRGIRDASVFGRDLEDTVNEAWGDGIVGRASHVLSKGYQAADNGIKRSAFVHEVNKWAKAEPNLTMDQIFDRAAEDVRATTQNYDLVPKLLREFSQRGVLVPTYVSFAYELLRNTVGTVRLASKEIRSGNPVLMQHGAMRVAGMLTIAAALYGMNEVLTNVLTGMTWEEKEKLRKTLPPWLEDDSVVFLRADDKALLYFDPSYLIPHQLFYNAASAVYRNVREKDLKKAISDPAKILADSLGDTNIFTQTVAEAMMNKKEGGGEIYNPEVDEDRKWELIAKHFKDNMFKPGFMRTIDKARKAAKHEVGFQGSTATMDDLVPQIFGIRPYRLDTSSERFVVDSLVSYGFRNSTISSYQSQRKEAKRTPEEKVQAQIDVDRARKKLEKDFDATIGMFQQLGISKERIFAGLKAANIPKDLRNRAHERLK